MTQARDLADGTFDSTTLVVDAANNRVGVGTTSPAVPFQVTGSSTYVAGVEGSSAYALMGFKASGTTGTLDDANVAIGATGNALYFRSGGAERMRIDAEGRLLLNASVNNVAFSSARSQIRYSKTGEFGLHIRPSDNDTGGGNPVLFQNYAGGTIGSISANASVVSYNTSSDYRLKTDVTYDWDATSRLKQLKPARFAWIADGDDAVPVDGFLAHEVQDVVPEAISGTKDAVDDEGNPEYQGIDQSKLVPLLVKTIQELEARITALETA